MAYSYQEAVSDGSLSSLLVTFSYQSREDIVVVFSGGFDTAWAWLGDTSNQILFADPLPNGCTVTVFRRTAIEAMRHTFASGAKFSARAVDEDFAQLLNAVQEIRDTNASVGPGGMVPWEKIIGGTDVVTGIAEDYRLLSAADATSKANAAQAAAVAAAQADATAKANLAEVTAKAYADGVVDAEELRAIADATAKANAARIAAIAAAAADATAKANAASAAAQAAAAADATAKANLATVTANAYADGVVSAEEARAIVDATAKANAAEAAAKAAAAADATAKANAAALTAQWSGVTGAGRPQDNATVGANGSNLNVGLGVNLLPNTEYAGNNIEPAALLWNPSGTPVTVGAELVRDPAGTDTPPGCNGLSVWQGGPASPAYGISALYSLAQVPVIAGARYEFSGRSTSYLCAVTFGVEYYNAAGTMLANFDTGVLLPGWASKQLSLHPQFCLFSVAPAGAVSAKPYIVKRDTDTGQSYSVVRVIQPHFGAATAAQTVASAYSPGVPRGALANISLVNTPNVADEAVTVQRDVLVTYLYNEKIITAGLPGIEVASLYVDAGGAPVTFLFSAEMGYGALYDSAQDYAYEKAHARLCRPDGTEIGMSYGNAVAAARSTAVGTYRLYVWKETVTGTATPAPSWVRKAHILALGAKK